MSKEDITNKLNKSKYNVNDEVKVRIVKTPTKDELIAKLNVRIEKISLAAGWAYAVDPVSKKKFYWKKKEWKKAGTPPAPGRQVLYKTKSCPTPATWTRPVAAEQCSEWEETHGDLRRVRSCIKCKGHGTQCQVDGCT